MFPKAQLPLSGTHLNIAISQPFGSTVVEINGIVVGFANLYRAKRNGVCCIGNVIVSPSARGERVATFIVEAMITYAFERYGAHEVQISCFNEHTVALLLYPSLGLSLIPLRSDFLGKRPIGPNTHDAQ